MAKYVEKPVVFEAIQFTKDNLKDVYEFINKEYPPSTMSIETIDGKVIVRNGDYIVKDSHSSLRIFDSGTFEKKYIKEGGE